MFHKRLLLTITLNTKKLKEKVEDSCEIRCIPVIQLLSEEEQKEVKDHINKACDLIRKAYIKSKELKK